ncbi:MAG: histidine utilization repressor [Geminicoccaceae bacterium]|nr:histidine utilization repressor [Geminicoccaceae bacterium]
MNAPFPEPARKDGPRSLHQRILADIEGAILSGAWPPGTQIPFEQDLAARYGCSRMTVNKVMTRLVAAGLIERRRKAGTFVRHPHSRSAILEVVDVRREVEGLGLPYGFEILRRVLRRSTEAEGARLGLDAPVDLVEIASRHFAARHPFCLEERLISLKAVPEAAAESFGDLPPGAWLSARVPWSTAEHRIRAVGADAPVAAALMVPRGTPCLRIERRTWSAREPITLVFITYPGERHELVARFAPG